MCGIAGCLSAANRLDSKNVVADMLKNLKHRGPDEAGVIDLGNVVLGATRLAILERTTLGSQPMHHKSHNIWLVFNGEIYNHHELRLQLPSYDYEGNSDTETLLHAFATWGHDVLQRINGIFAFAIFDPVQRKVTLARDRFGVKPLYFAMRQEMMFFASETKAIPSTNIPRHVSPETIAFNIANFWTNGRSTLLEGIERLLPGHVLEVYLDTFEITEHSWYNPKNYISGIQNSRYLLMPRSDVQHELEAALRSSVQHRLLSDAPIGCLCSGGLDSSLVTAIAAQEGVPFMAYNASFPEQPQIDENIWAHHVCKHVKVPLTTISLTQDAWRGAFVNTVYHFEYPLVHESNIPLSLIADQAARDGVRVLLSGEGADELFGGYPSRHLHERYQYMKHQPNITNYDLEQLMPQTLPIVNPLFEILKLANNDKARRYEYDVKKHLREAYSFLPVVVRNLEAALASDLWLFLEHSLSRLDKNVMQHSVEAREPFLDPHVVELGLNLPFQLRSQPSPKGVLLELGYKFLPQEILHRPKQGFSFDSRPYFKEAKSDFLTRGKLRELLKLDTRIWEEVLSNLSVGRTALRLWSTEVWLRLFVENQSPKDVETEMWLQ